jgi:hypothetical protein
MSTRMWHVKFIKELFIKLPIAIIKPAVETLDGLGKVQEDITRSPMLSLLISVAIVGAGIPMSLVFLGWFGKGIGYASTTIGIVGVGLSLRRLLNRNR